MRQDYLACDIFEHYDPQSVNGLRNDISETDGIRIVKIASILCASASTRSKGWKIGRLDPSPVARVSTAAGPKLAAVVRDSGKIGATNPSI
jgi:hypothetical protein